MSIYFDQINIWLGICPPEVSSFIVSYPET